MEIPYGFLQYRLKTAVGIVVSGIVNWYKGQIKVVFYILTF